MQLTTLQEHAKEQTNAKEQITVRTKDVFLLNVGGEIFVTSKDTLCLHNNSKLAKMVTGEDEQQFDKDGNLFIDQDPKDFVYVLKSLRVGGNIIVPKEAYKNVRKLAQSLGLGGGQFRSLD